MDTGLIDTGLIDTGLTDTGLIDTGLTDADLIDVRREPLVVRDGCAPDRIPLGRWPSDEALLRSEQFAVNEALACRGGTSRVGACRVFGVHAPPGTGVAEVLGDLVAAIVTERARRIADLADPTEAFGEARGWGAHTVTAPSPELAGFEVVLAVPDAVGGLARPGLSLPPIGAAWRERATRADYFASTARLADGVGAWAMLAARLGDGRANRAFAERWWHGAVRGTDVLFPAGESMAAALARLKGTRVYWPACVAWFRSTLARVQQLAAERMRVATALARLSALEQACEDASCAVEAARARLADLEAAALVARDAAGAAEEEYRAVLAEIGAHELSRPEAATITPRGVAALRSRAVLSVVVAGGIRRGRNWRNWSWRRRALRAAAAVAEQRWEQALRAAESLRDDMAAARAAVADRVEEVARLDAEMEPLAKAVEAARERWGDCVPVGPSQAETEDPALIEWRETSAPWADEEYTKARAEAFVAALELHKALIVARADVFEANLAALMELISADADAGNGTGAGSGAVDDEVRLAAWRSFFLVAPVVQVPFEAAGPLLAGFAPGSLGWLLAAGADKLAAEEVPGLLRCFESAVFAGDTLLAEPRQAGGASPPAPSRVTAQDLANGLMRYGTWLAVPPSAGRPSAATDGARPRWVAAPLRVVRGQDRTTVDHRNELGYDGLLITDQR